MDGLFDHPEFLRAEALRFVGGVYRNSAEAADQEVIWFGFIDDYRQLILSGYIWSGFIFDYTQFLYQVRLRFLNRPDGAGDTHATLTELVRSYFDGHSPRSRLHADVCILLIGHADLFNRFERLRFMNDDGRQETRRQIREWRNDVRNEIMPEVSLELADLWSAIERLRIMPETLDSRNMDFIARTCFPAGVDPNNVMANLVTDPASVRHHVLPTLEEKQTRFWRLYRFLARYFGQVASGAFEGRRPSQAKTGSW